MDATFDQEQEMLAQTAGRMADALGPSSVHDLESYDPSKAADELIRSGMLGLALPERLGGSGATCVEVAIVAEALARRLVPVPYVGPVTALELLAAAGQDELVSDVVAGDRVVTLGLDTGLEGIAEADAALVAWEAAGATHAVTRVGADGSWAPTLRSLQAASDVDCVDLTRRLRRLAPSGNTPGGTDLAGTDLAGTDLAGTDPAGTDPAGATPAGTTSMPAGGLRPDQIARWEAFALSLLCADMVGAMDGALALAVEHARWRVQFGRPIGSFQALQHICAEQLVDLEASRSATYHSAWAVGGLPADQAVRAARVAKSYVSRAGRSVTETVLQVLGGIGQTWESLAHVYLRRVLLDRVTLGDETVHVARLGASLVNMASGDGTDGGYGGLQSAR
ncbi:MAG: acyl-CoA dehydrogenase family protein [Acidobacteriota bacterium]|nr:acyl-CoA dehydrogenase family protein [Acidobacteriota bacterium]